MDFPIRGNNCNIHQWHSRKPSHLNLSVPHIKAVSTSSPALQKTELYESKSSLCRARNVNYIWSTYMGLQASEWKPRIYASMLCYQTSVNRISTCQCVKYRDCKSTWNKWKLQFIYSICLSRSCHCQLRDLYYDKPYNNTLKNPQPKTVANCAL